MELTPRAYPAFGDKLLYKDGEFSITWTKPKTETLPAADEEESETEESADDGGEYGGYSDDYIDIGCEGEEDAD